MMDWTGDNEKQLIELFEADKSAAEAAAVLNVSRNSIIGAWYRRGLRRKPKQYSEGGGASERSNPGRGAPLRHIEESQASSLQALRASTLRLEESVLMDRPHFSTTGVEHAPIDEEPPQLPPIKNVQDLPDGLTRCRWPEGDPGDPDFHFCGARTHGQLYCPEHTARAYQRRVKS